MNQPPSGPVHAPSSYSASELYGEEYYLKRFGAIPYDRNPHWLNFFSGIAEELIRSLRPRRVYDAGCAQGFLVEAFYDRGVDAIGRDISEYAISKVRPDIRDRCKVASLVEPVDGGPYDLVTCIEVLEHIPAEDMGISLDRICAIAEQILFSSTPSDFTEPTHVNVRPVIQWLREFEARGFVPDLAYDASFVAPHAFLVKRSEKRVASEVLGLLAETLRLRGERAAFLTRHNLIERLEGQILQLETEASRLHAEYDKERAAGDSARTELESVHRELHDARLNLDAARQAVVSERAANERHQRELTIQADELGRVRALLGQYENALAGREREIASLQVQSNDLQGRLTRATDEAAQARIAIEPWMESATQNAAALDWLTREAAALESELIELRTSPGWQLIMRYRQWLHRARTRSAWFRRHLEPFIARTLKRAGVGTPIDARTRFDFPPDPPKQLMPAPPARASLAGAAPARSTPSAAPASKCPSQTLTYQEWIKANEPTDVELEVQRRIASCLSYRPLISVVCPIHRTPLNVLREMISSVRCQTYDNWELCLTVSGSEDEGNLEYLRGECANDSRVKLRLLERNGGISSNSNAALEIASGDFLALLDHDDTLAPFALYEVVRVLNRDRTVQFIYSDKDQIDSGGSLRVAPLFKPKWSPEVMWNANYLTHLCVMRTDDVRSIGGWRQETDGAQDWDLFNRVIRLGGSVHHIPKVLYHWRQLSTSVASGGLDAKPYASEAQIRAVSDHLAAVGVDARVTRSHSSDLRIQWQPPKGEKVSILLLGGQGAEAISKAEELVRLTDHQNYELLVAADAPSVSEGPIRPIHLRDDLDIQEQISELANAATGEVLALLDVGAVPADSSWLLELTGPLQLREIGLVGARLLDPDTHVVRHCGLVISSDGRPEAVYAGQPSHVNDLFGSAGWYRNWSAVSGASVALRKETWASLKGFMNSPLYPRIDVHLCLTLSKETGKRILYNPYATFYVRGRALLERPLTLTDDAGRATVRALFPNGDPYFHPELECNAGRIGFRQDVELSSPSMGNDYAAESRSLIQWFDASAETIKRSRGLAKVPTRGRLRSITWMLPEFSNAYYGGAHTILRFADAFQRLDAVKARFCFLGSVDEDQMRRRIGQAFPGLSSSDVCHVSDATRVDELPETDAGICTLWTTAYPLAHFSKTRRKFYLMQDDESLFYPAGSTSALVEATYGFGFKGICNTISLLNRYRAVGGEGEYFDPCIDPAVFHAIGREKKNTSRPLMLFAYARPNHPRNCFELLMEALRRVKSRMGDGLVIVTAGESWDPSSYGLKGVVHNLGLLDYGATGALYRACDAGTSLMMTRHPSYLPLELMACGSLVITNANKDTAWLLRDGENCLLSDSTPASLASRIEEGLRDVRLRRQIADRALEEIQQHYANWDVAATKVLDYMRKECEGQ